MKQHFTLEDQDGQERDMYLETEGTTMDASKGFKWKFWVMVGVVLGIGYLLLEWIWG